MRFMNKDDYRRGGVRDKAGLLKERNDFRPVALTHMMKPNLWSPATALDPL